MRNILASLLGQLFSVLVSLAARYVFVRTLSDDYLGVSGLFTNVLTMLSLVELGIGPAIVFSLYKPLADNDTEKIKSLMQLFKRAYTAVGCAFLVLGVICLPFYPKLIRDLPAIPHLDLIYLLFVVNTGISYFYSYKRSLVIADQKKYVVTLYHYAFYFCQHILQIVILLLTHNYILYLVLLIVFTWAENFFISRYADKAYPCLKESAVKKLASEDMLPIRHNIEAMVVHQVGHVVVANSDSVFLSRMFGLGATALYANYTLILQTLTTLTGQIFESLTASVGNLGASENKSKVMDIFRKLFFMDFWLFGFASICLLVLFNPFISIWLGEKYLFPWRTVLLIVISFYLTGMRQAVMTFKNAFGLYAKDWYKPLVESVLKITFSLLLGMKYGIDGIFAGTIISTLLAPFWIEPYVTYRWAFQAPLKDYYLTWLKYLLVTLVTGYITCLLCGLIPQAGLAGFVIMALLCLIIPNLLFWLIFRKTEEFVYFFKLVSELAKKIC